jgi:roadblock/LC7 domain-containing protein
MPGLPKLLDLPGVIATGRFSRKGLVEEFHGNFPADAVGGLLGLCAATTEIVEMEGLLLDRLTGKSGWRECYGWAMWGPERCIIAAGDSMCVGRTSEVSFDALLTAVRTAGGVE